MFSGKNIHMTIYTDSRSMLSELRSELYIAENDSFTSSECKDSDSIRGKNRQLMSKLCRLGIKDVQNRLNDCLLLK